MIPRFARGTQPRVLEVGEERPGAAGAGLISEVGGTSAECRVCVFVGKNARIVMKLHKNRLRGLTRRDSVNL